MKKKLLSVLLSVAMVSSLLAGCGSKEAETTEPAKTETTEEAATEETTDEAATEEAAGGVEGKVFAVLVKSAGNPYNERQTSGFQEVIEAAGATCIVKAPEAATAEAQITMINELVAQRVDAIAIAGNDIDALQPALTEAMNQGIKVLSFDSSVNADSRLVHVNQAGTDLIGTTLVDAISDIVGEEGGEFAILSATSQATNQNSWIEAMKKALEADARNLTLVDIAYGDDEFQKSVDETEALLKNYPNLKLICAPTTVGIMAAAKVLQDKGVTADIKLTGLGLPSEMADYIGDTDENATPYMYLWNPIEIGQLTAYTAMALVEGTITGAAGETYTAGNLGADNGQYTIVEAADGGTEVILGPPFKFDSSNIDEWKEVY